MKIIRQNSQSTKTKILNSYDTLHPSSHTRVKTRNTHTKKIKKSSDILILAVMKLESIHIAFPNVMKHCGVKRKERGNIRIAK